MFDGIEAKKSVKWKNNINSETSLSLNKLVIGGVELKRVTLYVSLDANTLFIMHHDSAGAGLLHCPLTLAIFSHSGRRWSTVEL